MRSFVLLLVPLVLLLTCLSGIVHAQAQTPPDAGSLLNQIRSDPPRQSIPEVARPHAGKAPQLTPLANGSSVVVKTFEFRGNTLVPREALEGVTAAWTGRPVGADELKEAAVAVANAYRARGWVVRTFLPPQDITDGLVVVQVVEARFGGVSIDGRSLSRVTPDQLSGIVEHQQATGALLNGNALDRAFLLAGDLPGVAVSSNLVPGTHDGETALVLQATDTALLQSTVTTDNTGSRATGSARIAAAETLNGLLGGGDQARADLIHTQGSDYLRLETSAPIGYDGFRAAVNVSALHYRLVADDFAALDASGHSGTVGMMASYPLWRGRESNVRLLATAERRTYLNTANAAVTSRYLVYANGFGIDADSVDEIGGGGFNNASLLYVEGRVDLDANPTQRVDGTAGGYRKFHFSLSRRQRLTDDWSLFAAWRGQAASGNLDSSEKFNLGGIGGVRAYPANEAGGAAGNVLTLEARRRLGDAATVTAFYDAGRIEQYRNNSGPLGQPLTGASPNAYSLAGYGISTYWLTPMGFSLLAAWARRVGGNPNASASGADQDGSLLRNRFWISAAAAF